MQFFFNVKLQEQKQITFVIVTQFNFLNPNYFQITLLMSVWQSLFINFFFHLSKNYNL